MYVVKPSRGMSKPSLGGYQAPAGVKPSTPRGPVAVIRPTTAMPGLDGEVKETITVFEAAVETVDTGLIDRNGNAIHRRLMQPIGFIRF